MGCYHVITKIQGVKHMKKRVLAVSVLFVFFCGASGLVAAEYPFPIETKTYKGISYISSGVGTDERKTLSHAAKDFGLKLLFAVEGGELLTEVAVVIQDSAGSTVMDLVSEGPWFFAKLPPGKYTVSAKANHDIIKKSAEIKKSGQTELRFFWMKHD